MGKKFRISILGIIAVVIYLFISFFFMLVPINLHAYDFWVTIIISCLLYGMGNMFSNAFGFFSKKQKPKANTIPGPFVLAIILILILVIISFSGAKIFHAKSYASSLPSKDVEFTEDIPEA